MSDRNMKNRITSTINLEIKDFLTTISFTAEVTVDAEIVISGASPTGIYILMPTLLTAAIPTELGAP